jgi:sensor histidine kinase regulating citrate/malate metabolism
MDNAEEACAKREQGREISLSIHPARDGRPFTLLVENTFAFEKGKLVFTGGLPATTKPDRDLHGYGLRSVRRIVRQYGGNLDLSVQEEEMRFLVLITI